MAAPMLNESYANPKSEKTGVSSVVSVVLNRIVSVFKKEKVEKVYCVSAYHEDDASVAYPVNVTLYCNGRHYCLQALCADDLYHSINDRLAESRRYAGHTMAFSRNPRFYLEYRGRYVRNANIPLSHYGMKDGARVDVIFALLSGGSTPSEKKEREIAFEYDPSQRKGARNAERIAAMMQMQNEEYIITSTMLFCTWFVSLFKPKTVSFELQSVPSLTLMESRNKVIATFRKKADGEYITDLIEAIAIFGYQLMRSRSHADRAVALAAFAKMRSDKPLLSRSRIEDISKYLSKLFGEMEVQSEEYFSGLRSGLDHYSALKNGPLAEKLHKLLMYALSLSLFDRIGITFDSLNYTKMEAEAIKRKHHAGPDLIFNLLDTLDFLAQRGYQCVLTGSLDPIFHGSASYEKWYLAAIKLQQQSKFLSNPEAQNFTMPEFLSNLDNTIEQGKAIARHTASLSEYDRRLVKKVLADLELIKATELTRRAAGKDRKAPFSLLVVGGSSIAKSAFTKMLYYHYGKVMGLPIEDEYRYVRNPNDQFWSGFTTSKWCIQLDDIAYLHPNKATNGDPSILEMLQVVNSVPFVPNQAELDDKGRTPMQAKLVVATTNCKELNAFHYFHCPLAIQRRLPWVVTLSVKPECAKNAVFLDANKTNDLRDGGYPDYWDILVEKVVPAGEDIHHQAAIFETVKKFNNVYDFIQWYSKTAKAFEAEQDIVEKTDVEMRQLQICETCYLPSTKCECLQEQSIEFVSSLLSNIICGYLSFCLKLTWTVTILNYAMRFQCVQDFITRQMYFTSTRVFQSAFARLGERVHRRIGYFHLFIIISTFIGTITVYARLLRWIFTSKEPTYETQGSNLSKDLGRTPEANDKRENVWYNDQFVCTTFDAPARGISWNSLQSSQVYERLSKNIVELSFTRTCGTEVRRVDGYGIVIKGNYLITNNHNISPDSASLDVFVRLKDDKNTIGVRSSFDFQLFQEDVRRYPTEELAIFKLRGLPPFADISDLFVDQKFRCIGKGDIVSLNHGAIETKAISNVRFSKVNLKQLGDRDVWIGNVPTPTEVGDCGSPWIVNNGTCYFIAGIHVGGANNTSACVPITKEFLQMNLTGTVIEPTEPKISSLENVMEVQSLHFKSPFRYIQNGCAQVYGSLMPRRITSGKSKVVQSSLAPLAKEEGYVSDMGPPVMSGWVPWRNAIMELVNPIKNFKMSVLDEVKTSFIQEIKETLPADQLKDLMVYDRFTAVNGANGVRFVDKMNRNTSMGHPWRKSKKFYMKAVEPTKSCSDPMEFDPEIYERVDQCLQSYYDGQRYSPVFAGSLKDEPRSAKKIATGNTRMFCGSPADWNIVVRMHYLSFIRVLQNNRFVFESAPGTVAQSKEWHDIYSYLNSFGGNKMIAGDYKAFDKRMPPAFMLAAFEIIIEICKSSGNFTDKDIQVMWGVAYDTCFPVVDINGDLVQLYGSNPSGHPLTVIINGLVNCLYVRYAYHQLNPKKTAVGFKKEVKLMTYGDDNVMGCSNNVPWFTHTTLANELNKMEVIYTMADKEAESVPYIHISEISFLKRTFRYDDDIGFFVCPIEEASIAKMLIWSIPSKTVCQEAQMIAVLSTVCREYFWYGKDVFLAKREMCKNMMRKAGLESYEEGSTFPTYGELLAAYRRASDLPDLE